MFSILLIVVIALVVAVLVIVVIAGRSKSGGRDKGDDKDKPKDKDKSKDKSKGNSAVFKNAMKKLSQNPKDPEALFAIGDYHYQQESWEDAYKAYSTLTEVGGSSNEFQVYARYGMCALKLGNAENAYKGFTVARSLYQNDFEVNYNLGSMEFQKKNYEKAIQLLQVARTVNPEDAATLRTLGHAFFKLNKHKEAMTFIRKAIDIAPDDRESLYVLGECYFEANQIEQALKIFAHLRPDPAMGASASLFSGTINLNQHRLEKAIEDFEIGLKHENIKPDLLLDLRYKLASAYLRKDEIGKALPLLKQIQSDTPGYKDVPALIAKYQELNANKTLQVFLMGSSADFVALCRKIVMAYYKKARVKIIDISVTRSEWADISAEVDTAKWSDTVAFRFIRTQGSIGELIVRDFHSHLKETKVGKGICLTVGTFSDEAKRFTEARLIDLIEKERFTAILNTVDARPAPVAAAGGAKRK